MGFYWWFVIFFIYVCFFILFRLSCTNKGDAILKKILCNRKILYFYGKNSEGTPISFVSSLYILNDWKVSFRYCSTQIGVISFVDDTTATYSNYTLSYKEVSIKETLKIMTIV